MNAFTLLTAVLILACGVGFLNARTLRLPASIGMLAAGLIASIGAIGLGRLFPSMAPDALLAGWVRHLHFSAWFLQGALPFLLFAGALELDLAGLIKQKGPVLALSVISTLVSTVVVGFGSYWLFGLLGVPLSLAGALLFGALISPTDPIAILGILKSLGVSPELEIIIAGESLFNDGVAVVIFSALLSAVTMNEGTAGGIAACLLFMREVGGGLLLGMVAGWLAFQVIKRIDESNVEILMTITLVLVIIWCSVQWNLSAALAAVVAGLLIGNPGRRLGMSPGTRVALGSVWSFGDYLLNALLFVLLGLQVLAIGFKAANLWPAVLAIPLTLGARLVSVAIMKLAPGFNRHFSMTAVLAFVWGGLRGGIPVALALSLPPFPGRLFVLQSTYVVVIFSVLVQGVSFPRFLRRLSSLKFEGTRA